MSRLKPPQVLRIHPEAELKFKGPFTDVVTSSLSLTNPTDKRVCFKVKTTAPRRYCVRPNSGFVEANATVTVSVMLQPFDSDPAELGKHKFMVQTMYAPDVVENIDELWKSAASSELMDSKLRCMFEPPTETADEEQVSAAPAAPIVESSALSATSEPNNELNSIMEECKRLQSENANLKQLNDKLKSNSSPSTDTQGVAEQQKRMMIIFLLIAFATGIILGYVMS